MSLIANKNVLRASNMVSIVLLLGSGAERGFNFDARGVEKKVPGSHFFSTPSSKLKPR